MHIYIYTCISFQCHGTAFNSRDPTLNLREGIYILTTCTHIVMYRTASPLVHNMRPMSPRGCREWSSQCRQSAVPDCGGLGEACAAQ